MDKKVTDRLAFQRKIALVIGMGLILLMLYYAFLLPEVADCNAYYEKEFVAY